MKNDNRFLKKQLDKIGKEAVDFLTKFLLQKDKNASGELIDSLDYEVIERGNNILLQIIAAEQFKYVDEGRKKGAKPPPISAISSWLKVKGIKGRSGKTGRFITREQTSYIISRAISKNGIKALNLKQKLIKDIFDKKDQLIADAVGQDINDIINRIFYVKI